MTYIFDACAMIAYLRGEPGVDVVREILHDPANHPSVLSTAELAEN